MSQAPGIFALVPHVTSDAAKRIEFIRRHYKCTVEVVIPSGLDGINISALREIQKHASRVFTFSTTPVEIKNWHQETAIRVAVHYELGRVAIALHYQNLRDQLVREYGLRAVRDTQVEKILSTSKQIVELRDHVYKSKVRYRDLTVRDLVKNWNAIIASNAFDAVYDLPNYIVLLHDWFKEHSNIQDDECPKVTTPMYWQVTCPEEIKLIGTNTGTMEARRIYGAGAEYLSGALLSDLVFPFLTPIDDDVLDQLEKADGIRKALESKPLGRQAIDCLKRYAHLWMDYIPNQIVRGQEQKWRGWYLVPEHGPLTLEKLWELQRILVELEARASTGSCVVDTSHAGINNVLALLKAGGVVYRKSYPPSTKRAFFIRQQKNYLVRLGLVTEIASGYLSVSDLGISWLSIKTDSELRAAFKSIMEEIRWTWCNMPFFNFAREVARSCDGHISFEELSNWIIHAYDQSQLVEVVLAVQSARQLPESQRGSLNNYCETKLRSLLDKHMSAAAFGHYKTKIRDLMVAFSTTGDFVVKGDGQSARLVLTAQGRK